MAKTKDVRAAVEKELGFDPRVDSAHVTVSNISGDVTLTATVPSYPQYLEAAVAARRVAGVTGVHNHRFWAGAGPRGKVPGRGYMPGTSLGTAAGQVVLRAVASSRVRPSRRARAIGSM